MIQFRIALALFCALLAAPVWAANPICRAKITHIAEPLNACLGEERVKIAAVGDILLHRPLQGRGYKDADGFRGIWRAVEPIFRAADIAYANLEGPVAPGLTRGAREVADPGPVFDNRVYTSFPLFNYHPNVITDLQASGINLVSTANNHAMDRGTKGADLTIEALMRAKLPYFGTIRADHPRGFVTHTASKLGQIAWIACTYSNNGNADPNDQVLHCYENREELLGLISAQAMRAGVNAVIVTPHWGTEYSHSPNRNQRALAADMTAAGATAVIGTHPHVVQPWEMPLAADGSKGLVIYSTGNFVSGQVKLPRRTGALAWIELCRQRPSTDLATALGSKLVVAQAGWVPLLMTRKAAGPELELVNAQSTGLAANARRLLERYVPGRAVLADASCRVPDATLLALQ